MDAQAFFTKWLRDMRSAQKEDGGIPNTVPFESMPGDPNDNGMPVGSSGWGDAAVIIPYRLYAVYGDRQLLADISPVFYSATVVDPKTGAQVTKSFYTATVPFGAQRLNRETGAPYYDGVAFSMIER